MKDILRTINAQGHELYIYGTTEEPLFLAVEVAKMIDYSVGKTGQMLNTVDRDEKLTDTIHRATALMPYICISGILANYHSVSAID